MNRIARVRANASSRGGVQTLLAWMGVPKHKVFAEQNLGSMERARANLKRRSKIYTSRAAYFWGRDPWELADLIREARVIYKKRIKEAHPDRPGGSHSKAVRLNLAMQRLEKLFSRRR